jgi:hypothetical protein
MAGERAVEVQSRQTGVRAEGEGKGIEEWGQWWNGGMESWRHGGLESGGLRGI